MIGREESPKFSDPKTQRGLSQKRAPRKKLEIGGFLVALKGSRFQGDVSGGHGKRPEGAVGHVSKPSSPKSGKWVVVSWTPTATPKPHLCSPPQSGRPWWAQVRCPPGNAEEAIGGPKSSVAKGILYISWKVNFGWLSSRSLAVQLLAYRFGFP